MAKGIKHNKKVNENIVSNSHIYRFRYFDELYNFQTEFKCWFIVSSVLPKKGNLSFFYI